MSLKFVFQFRRNDGLPQNVCFDCLKTFSVISEFRKRCEDVQKILGFYNKSSLISTSSKETKASSLNARKYEVKIKSAACNKETLKDLKQDEIRTEVFYQNIGKQSVKVNIKQHDKNTDKSVSCRIDGNTKNLKRSKRKSALICLKKIKTNNFDLTDVSFSDDNSCRSDFSDCSNLERHVEKVNHPPTINKSSASKSKFDLNVEKDVKDVPDKCYFDSVDESINAEVNLDLEQHQKLVSSDEDIKEFGLNDSMWQCESSQKKVETLQGIKVSEIKTEDTKETEDTASDVELNKPKVCINADKRNTGMSIDASQDLEISKKENELSTNLGNVRFAEDENFRLDFRDTNENDNFKSSNENLKQESFCQNENDIVLEFCDKVDKLEIEPANSDITNLTDETDETTAGNRYIVHEDLHISSNEDIDEFNLNDTNWESQFSIDSSENAVDHLILEKENDYHSSRGNKSKSMENYEKTKRKMPKRKKSKCPYCHKLYEVVITHIRKCAARSDLLCRYCDLALKTKSELNDHIEKLHSNGLPGCHICFASFENTTKRSDHIRIEHQQIRYPCVTCGREFTRKNILEEHIERRHTETINKECSKCQKVLKTEFLYQRHLKQHKMEDRLKCQFCGKLFTRKQFKINHERVHTGEKPYLCDICGLGFATLIDLNFHIKSSHNPDPGKPKYSQKKATKKKYLYKPKPKQEQLRFKCALCPYEFGTSYGLDQHLRRHTEERKYECQYCGNGFNRLVHLKMHEKRVHLKLKDHKCLECGKEFFEKYELKAHMIVHQDDRPLKCDHCPARFKQKKRLKAHSVTHTKDKPYVCAVCGKRYKFTTNLQVHFQGHTEEEIKQVERKLLIDMEANQLVKILESDIIKQDEQIENDEKEM